MKKTLIFMVSVVSFLMFAGCQDSRNSDESGALGSKGDRLENAVQGGCPNSDQCLGGAECPGGAQCPSVDECPNDGQCPNTGECPNDGQGTGGCGQGQRPGHNGGQSGGQGGCRK